MLRTRALLVPVLVTACLLGSQPFDKLRAAPRVERERNRANVPDRYKWNLADLYASDDAWRAAKDALVGNFPKIAAFKGTLGSSPARLADALDTANRLAKDLQRLSTYAGLISDQDTRVAKYQGMS